MTRASLGDAAFWKHWTEHSRSTIHDAEEQIERPSANPRYRPQYIWNLVGEYRRLMLRIYSKGDDVNHIAELFPELIHAWELSNASSEAVCEQNNLSSCRDWTFDLADLNHYNWCFWLIGLALALEIPEVQWKRLLVLVSGEGRDILLDRIIASREPARRIGTELLHPKPYARLLKAIDAPKEKQAQLLRDFVDHWYPELARKGKDELWWYIYGDPIKHPLKMGSYFGRWCIEAVAAVKAFGLDDSACLGHEHYPGDLLRPNGPTTHRVHSQAKQGLVARWLRRAR